MEGVCGCVDVGDMYNDTLFNGPVIQFELFIHVVVVVVVVGGCVY